VAPVASRKGRLTVSHAQPWVHCDGEVGRRQ
jgi:hypothetical protein